MGKKDAAGLRSAPVDQYRKQIGKQDWKKSKREIKSSKVQADKKKTATPVKDTLMILMAGLMVIVGSYLLLYWYLNKEQT